VDLSIVILAAGQGKRMHSDLPKVLQPLAGRPLLRHVVDTARALEPTDIYVVYGHQGERVREALRDAPVSWVHQAEQLGTGHAVREAAQHIPDSRRVLVLYGDVPLLEPATLRALVAKAGPRALALLTVMLEDPTGYGRIVRDTAGRVRRIVEEKEATARVRRIREANTGVMVAPAGLLKRWLAKLKARNAAGEYYLTDVVGMAVADRLRVHAVAAPSVTEALGVNDKRQLAAAEAAYRARRARELLDAGVTVIDPLRLDVRGPVTVGRDVEIDVNVVLEGRVALGDRVRLGAHCVLRDVEIGADTEVFPNSVLEGAVIGAHCRIGPFARLRPTTRLADGVHIGNFVEIKNSGLGADSKANHLAYVGDASVGARVNVGAGTIVANYDGAHKHRSVLGDDVFTGSNSVLVAPIEVGAGATIAAGSTVVDPVPAGKLTVARARQTTLPNWTRPTKARK
jgi:bifunctional UDP-N-acetylglucosamine pyrophosphorylase/glucosamine-1-phosphate N-acetyltransferase